MKRIIYIASILTLAITFGYSQKYDNVWLMGSPVTAQPSIPFLPAFDFYFGDPDPVGFATPINMFTSNASICDPGGDLLLYSNGYVLMNKFHQPVPGSAGFNDDSLNIVPPGSSEDNNQKAIILPVPEHPGKYYIIHTGPEHSILVPPGGSVYRPVRLAYSIVDADANSGHGQMVAKNKKILQDTLLFNSLQAVRHGNGRDWWIVAREYGANRFYTALLTPDGLQQVAVQAGGPPKIMSGSSCVSLFSPDGSWFAMTDFDIASYNYSDCYLWRFDRCSGKFTYKKQLTITGGSTGCSFSPNSQLLYLGSYERMFQYNLAAPNISISEKTVAYATHFSYSQGVSTGGIGLGGYQKLGPDHKIYIASNNSRYVHIIEHPNVIGTGCTVRLFALETLFPIQGGRWPLHPNYLLGKLTGSACDSLQPQPAQENLVMEATTPDQSPAAVTMQPNPATDILQIETPFNAADPDEFAALSVFTPDGKLVWTRSFDPGTSNSVRVDVATWPGGLYLVRYLGRKSHWEGRFVKM